MRRTEFEINLPKINKEVGLALVALALCLCLCCCPLSLASHTIIYIQPAGPMAQLQLSPDTSVSFSAYANFTGISAVHQNRVGPPKIFYLGWNFTTNKPVTTLP